MGRQSKLTDKQWGEVKSRLFSGEKAADLAREYGVSKALISQRFSERIGAVKEMAQKIVEVDRAFKLLPISDQIDTISLVDEMKAISSHLAGAARFGAATAHRLSGIAHGKVQEIDDAAPIDDESLLSLKGIAVLTRMANEASEIPLGLLKANKEMVDSMNQPAKPVPQRIMVEVQDASMPGA